MRKAGVINAASARLRSAGVETRRGLARLDLGLVALARRLAEHEQGTYCGYTACRRPVKLVYCQEMPTLHEAFLFERQIKGWSRRKKEALIAGSYDLLPGLSRSRRAG